AVSHSRPLAEAAVDLALRMGGDDPPAVRVAAGGPDGDLGTDATAIAAALDEVDSGDGVLVLMDLGSALLSAEMALEFAA
ncbi:PTS-dependent dihydroxyacetone kinase phosphotransferase subunit DhaM, partial [Streptomyces galilaeus]